MANPHEPTDISHNLTETNRPIPLRAQKPHDSALLPVAEVRGSLIVVRVAKPADLDVSICDTTGRMVFLDRTFASAVSVPLPVRGRYTIQVSVGGEAYVGTFGVE